MDNALYELALDIAACRQCRLWASRTNTVPGEGTCRAGVVLIGEAPGYHEDLQGRPFVGDAGQVLDRLLARAELSRYDVYIGNVLKCRPPNNRNPTPVEVQACTPYLRRQLDLLRPHLVVTLGRFATAFMTAEAGKPFTSISKMRGNAFEVALQGQTTAVLPTYHPAAALYNPRYREALDDDFSAVKALLAQKTRKH